MLAEAVHQAELEQLERQFWTGGAQFYTGNLAADAVMVFADPVGVLRRERIVETIAAAPRWRSVTFEDVSLVELAPNVRLLTYRARAERQDELSPYAALVSSAYVRRDGRWQLAFHQQTPARSA